MEDDREEHWRKLCAEAANEQDPDKLLVLARQIIAMVDYRLTKKGAQKQSLNFHRKAKPRTKIQAIPYFSCRCWSCNLPMCHRPFPRSKNNSSRSSYVLRRRQTRKPGWNCSRKC
jgi:hypothetical protein